VIKIMDKRSCKVLVIPDYVINPQRYHDLPQSNIIYQSIKESGYGVIKLPPQEISEESAEPWIDMAADMIEEYLKRRYLVAVIEIDHPKMRTWVKELMEMLEKRRAPRPKLIKISRIELERAEKILERIKTIS